MRTRRCTPCESRGFEIEMIDRHAGEEAGIKTVTFAARGDYAFGYLKSGGP